MLWLHPAMTTPVFRFAPSPNGYLHLGHALSALLNFEMARAAGGRFLLRIEDIDATRCRPEFETAIYEDLAWLGLDLGDAGAAAVRAFRRIPRGAGEARSPGPDLSELRKPRRDRASRRRPRVARALAARSRRRAALSRRCRACCPPRSARPGSRRGEPYAHPARHGAGDGMGRPAALVGDRRRSARRERRGRRRTPPPGATSSSGARRRRPAIISSVVIDDALQGVTHVVRGQDLFWSTSVHRLLQALLGLPTPSYHHHRLILDADGRKLSKSTRATALRELRAHGVTPANIRADGRALAVASVSKAMPCCVGAQGRGVWCRNRGARGSCKAARKARPRRRPAARNARAIEAALAGLAHDIRTPLTGILALAELLDASDLPEREHRWAAAIKGAAEHLARLTTLVVDAAKAEASGLVLRDGAVLAARSRALGRGRADRPRRRQRPRRPRFRLPEVFPGSAVGDPMRLRSALENLIDNAVKFTERGSVTFAVSADRDCARPQASRLHRHRQRHRHRRERSQAAVPAVLAGQRGCGAPLRRRGAGPCFRQAHRHRDGRRSHRDQQARPRQHLSPQCRWRRRRLAPEKAQRSRRPKRRAAFACSASRTILTAASCSTPCSANSAIASASSAAARRRSRRWRAAATTRC